ncbi:hypothetical protein J3459_006318 [Metarhizium acridum]|nr:hypothetical protein J3459_006318 [Metarhizium acridum]
MEVKIDALEKKVATLTTIHKEQDSRSQALRKDKERAEKDAKDLKAKVEKLESENQKLRSRKSAERAVADLMMRAWTSLRTKSDYDLKRRFEVLNTKCTNCEAGHGSRNAEKMEATNTGFHDVDLSGGSIGHSSQRKHSTSGFGEFLTNGLNALAGGGVGGGGAGA